MRRTRCILVSAALAVAGFAPPAAAVDDLHVRFTRPLGSAPQAVGESASPGGALGPGHARKLIGLATITALARRPAPEAFDLSVAVDCQPNACGTPTVFVADSTFLIDWPSDCVAPGDEVTLHFQTSKGPITIVRAYFADAAFDSIAPALWSTKRCPTGPWTQAGLVALLGVFGAVAARRRLAG